MENLVEEVKSALAETVNRSKFRHRRHVTVTAFVAAVLVVTADGSANNILAQSVDSPLDQSGVPAEEQLYRDISDALVQQVLSAPDAAGADDLLARALAVDPENGDAMYRLAVRLRGSQEVRVRRRELLTSALDARRVDTPREDIVAELAELLLAQGRGTEALELLEAESRDLIGEAPVFSGVRPVIAPMEEIPVWSTDPEPSRIERLYVQALLHAGPRWFSAAYVQRLRSRFPTNSELAVIDFTRNTRLSLSLLEWIDRETGEGRQVPPELLLHGILVAKDTEMRQRLARRYRAAGGTDLLGEVAERPEDRMATAVEHADKYVLERAVAWAGEGGQSPGELIQREEAPDLFLLDTDRDQFWEERYHLNGETLAIWEHDIFQDGIVDQRVELVFQAPTGALHVWHREVSDDGVHVHGIEYAPYPNVARVTEFFQSRNGTDVSLVEWRPARPIGHTLRGSGPWATEEWNVATDRVTLDYDGITRFERQIRSDDARWKDDAAVAEHARQLRSWEMIR